jgi:hypothetical protein
MQVNFVTRSGTNAFHGRIYAARNSGLFANTYSNNASGLRRAKVITTSAAVWGTGSA